LPLFDPQHEGSLAYLAVARLIYPVPPRPRDPQPAAEAPSDQPQGDVVPAATEAVLEGNETTI